MTTDQVTVAILGAGSWGTTFAKVLADAAAFRNEDITIRLWARREEVAHDINTNHTNSEYLDDIVLPNCITATSDAAKAVRGAELVVVAVPAQQARTTLHQVANAIDERAILVSLIKGLEQEHKPPCPRCLPRSSICLLISSWWCPDQTSPKKSRAKNPPPPWSLASTNPPRSGSRR